MTAIQEIAMTVHSVHQYQATSDSMESIEYHHTMEELEYQVDTNNVVHKINIYVVAQQSHEITELSTSNIRSNYKKIPDDHEDLIPKKEKLDLKAPSDSNGIYI